MKLDLKEWIAKVTRQTEYKTLVWSNSSASAFSAQTIPFTTTDYDYIEIWFYPTSAFDASAPNVLQVQVGGFGSVVLFHNLNAAGVNENTGTRTFSVPSTGVEVSDYKYKNRRTGGTQTTANQFLIPRKIYGVKYIGA